MTNNYSAKSKPMLLNYQLRVLVASVEHIIYKEAKRALVCTERETFFQRFVREFRDHTKAKVVKNDVTSGSEARSDVWVLKLS